MVSREFQKRVRNFLLDRLEETPGIRIKELGENYHSVLIQKDSPENNDSKTRTSRIILHYNKPKISDYLIENCRNNVKGFDTSNIFVHGGDEQFFKRLGKIADFKSNKSFKLHSEEELKNISKISGIVKVCLDQIEDGKVSSVSILPFYEPESKDLPERIKGYSFSTVFLDYCHLTPEDPGFGFARNGISSNWKIVAPAYRIYQGGLDFRIDNSDMRIATIIPPKRTK